MNSLSTDPTGLVGAFHRKSSVLGGNDTGLGVYSRTLVETLAASMSTDGKIHPPRLTHFVLGRSGTSVFRSSRPLLKMARRSLATHPISRQ